MNDGVERGARRWAPSRGAVGVTWLLLPGSVWVSLTLAEGWRGELDPKLGLAPEGLARAAGLQVPRAVATAGDEAEQGAHHRALPGQRGEARLGGGAGGGRGALLLRVWGLLQQPAPHTGSVRREFPAKPPTPVSPAELALRPAPSSRIGPRVRRAHCPRGAMQPLGLRRVPRCWHPVGGPSAELCMVPRGLCT